MPIPPQYFCIAQYSRCDTGKVVVFPTRKKKLYLPQIRKFCKKRSTHLKNLEQRPCPLPPKFFLAFFFSFIFLNPFIKWGFYKNKIVYLEHFVEILITTQADMFVKDRRGSFKVKTTFNIFIFSNPFDNGSRWFLRGQRGVWLHFKVMWYWGKIWVFPTSKADGWHSS